MRSKICACAVLALPAGVASAADEYHGYLSINGGHYRYRKGRPEEEADRPILDQRDLEPPTSSHYASPANSRSA